MEWSEYKERGNRLYQAQNFNDAVTAYDDALRRCIRDEDRSIVLKNRAAAYIKLREFDQALADCDAAIQLFPRDIKALYRRSQALEGRGELSEAFKSVKTVLTLDSKNKEAADLARRIAEAIRRQADKQQSTSEKVRDMFSTLESGTADKGLKIQAAKNFAILSRDSSGREQLLSDGGLGRLVKMLDSDSEDVVHHILQAFVGLCGRGLDLTVNLIQAISLNKLRMFVNHSHKEISLGAVMLLKTVVVTLNALLSPASKDLVVAIIELILVFVTNPDTSSTTRDLLLEAITATIQQKEIMTLYLDHGLINKLLELSTSCYAVNPKVAVSDDCHMNICVVLSKLKELFTANSEEKERVQTDCQRFILKWLKCEDVDSVVGGLAALSIVLQSMMDVGNDIISESIAIDKAVEMANSELPHCQEVAAEVFSLAASSKSRCDEILQKGLPMLKQLYSSSSDSVKVRALVGLCRLGSAGGSNINARIFADDSTVKLEKMCRKFLVGSRKSRRLCRWAIEGLAFLSINAEVKEALVVDSEVLETLYGHAKNSDQSQLYGIATILVNLTNSYDKPERNPELEELGKYAGENVPKEHEFDGEEHVKKRVTALMQGGVVSCLIQLASSESAAICEQASRVFLALCGEPHHRGPVIQSGGVKSLLALVTSVNTEKGKLIAAQALAKIGISNDPRLAFPGQRSLEVIRPLVKLLKSEHGLQQFEGLMALTNLASTSEDVRQRIFREGAVPLMETLMFEEHELIRRASTEALCNMLSLDQVHERFYGDDIERIKLWTLFSGEDDEKLALAASGGLAQLTHDPILCKKVLQVKSAFDILKELLAHPNPDLQYRGTYILTNLVMADAETAKKIVDSDFLEVFMALAQTSTTPERVRVVLNKALAKCVDYGLIKPNH